mmetsp:Transcript_13014/g.35714  ORF Transcript_13014/g.35714 Transcript_13014/m.35714 type:complete len:332 (-) Transcript_13014:1037-2032(-)
MRDRRNEPQRSLSLAAKKDRAALATSLLGVPSLLPLLRRWRNHRAELLEINASVAVGVALSDQPVDLSSLLFPGGRAANGPLQLLARDLAVAVSVKDPEGRPAQVLLGANGLVHGGRDELGIVQLAGAVAVDRAHNVLHLVWHRQALLHHALADLLTREHAVAVLVQRSEQLPGVLCLLVRQLLRHGCERDLLQRVEGHKVLQRGHEAARQEWRLRLVLPLEPGICERCLCRGPAGDIGREHVVDHCLGIGGDFVPIGGREFEVPPLDLLEDGLVIVTVEGRIATKQDVQDDTNAPNVALLVVLSPQHLRCHVVRRPDAGGHGNPGLKGPS